MPITCALPPLDQRYARVAARNTQGFDLVAFSRGRPAGGIVIAPVAGTAVRRADLFTYGYRNPVVIETAEPRLFFVFSGLAFTGRAEGAVTPGTPIGEIEVPGRIDFLRARDRTAGVNPSYAYLHVEVWTRMPAMFELFRSSRGEAYRLTQGVRDPGEVWPSIGIDFVGVPGSEVMAVLTGGPADCMRRR